MTATVARCSPRLRSATRAFEEVGEERDGRRRRDGVRRAASLPDSRVESARDGRDRARARHERSDSPEARGARRARELEPLAIPEAQLELRELDERPRRRLGLARRRIERETHGGDRSFTIAVELARVRDARIRGEARTERDHALEGGEGRVVPAELDEGVADDAVRTRRAREQPLGAAAVLERRAELVPDERERAEPENRVGILAPNAKRPAQRRLGAREVRGIGGLAPAQLIREPELRRAASASRG